MSGEGASDLALEKTVSAEDAGVTPGGANVDSGRLATGTRLGRYEIVEFIGGGGMGWVYRATDTELEREVAIKVVQPTVAGPKGRDRLLAEARAMAKLRHRAVVPVFDVGEYAGGVYVAMALVKGGTLHDWMHAEARPWRQVVARFLEAGRGLVAAHAAGIVHRDFKPRNVLMGEGGEVMVADFGIASASVEASDDEGVGGRPRDATSIVGTPAYMAPEQAAGQAVDARADQYSFCVSLWEGLHGQRPQEAETRTQGALLAGATEAPKSRRRVPGWLTDAVARGFAPAPEMRWPTLAALLERLERGTQRARRWLFAGAAAIAAVLGVVAWRGSRDRDECPDPKPRIAAVWSEAIKAEFVDAFARLDPQYREDTLARLVPVLDRYAEAWRVGVHQVCRATHVEHLQSAQLLDVRMACFDRRLAALGALVDGYRGPGALVEQAITAALELAPVEECAQLGGEAGRALLAPALRERVEALDDAIDAARAWWLRGDYAGYLSEAERIAAAARQVSYPPLTLRALSLLNNALGVMERPSLEVMQEFAKVAAEAKDDEALTLAWWQQIYILHANRGDPAAAKALEPVLATAIARVEDSPRVRYRAAMARGLLRDIDEDREAAAAEFRAAAAAAATDLQRLDARSNVATALGGLNRWQEAAKEREAIVAETARVFGPLHPRTGLARARLAKSLIRTGDLGRAEQELLEAKKTVERAVGNQHAALAEVLLSLGNLFANLGRLVDAEAELRRAVAIYDKSTIDGQIKYDAINALAGVVGKLRGVDGSRELYGRALDGYARLLGRDSKTYAGTESALAGQLAEAGKCGDAIPLLSHASDVLATSRGPGRVIATYYLARCELAAGNLDQAFAGVQRARILCEEGPCIAGQREELLSAEGSWLIHSKRDARRGAAMMREAAAGFRKLGNVAAAERIDAYLSTP
jgi:tetratricopeptide (TPR) repeat protein